MKKLTRLAIAFTLVLCPLSGQDNGNTNNDSSSQENSSNGNNPSSTPSSKSSTENDILASSLKDIPEIIDYSYTEKEGLLNVNPVEPIHKIWTPVYLFYRDKMHIDLALAYTTLYQRATAGVRHEEAAGDDFDFYGLWTICDKEKSRHPSSIGFSCESRSKWTSIPPFELGENIGSLWETVNTFSEEQFTLIQLWWEYHFIPKKFGFRVGKIDQTDYFNLYSFISANFSFLNQGLTSDITIGFPDNGLGAVIGYKPTKETFLFTSIGDMNGLRTSWCLDSFFSENEYFKAMEFSYKPSIPCLGDGNYNIMIWHSDKVKKNNIPSSQGIALTLEQGLRGGFTPFLRYGHSDGKNTGVTDAVATGFGVTRPFCRENDEFGLGVVWGKPRDHGLSNQVMCESYYRLQLTHHIEISPDIGVIFNPTFNPDHNVIGVFSFRFRANL